MSEALNIIKAHFGSLREVTTAPVWQYDYGKKLEIDGIPNLPSTFEIHYSNSKARGTAKRWIGYDGVVDVLDEYLLSGADVWCFIFLHEGEDDGQTEYVIHIPVKERSETEDAQPTPVQQDIVTETIAALNAAVAQCGAYVEHYPTVIDGYWYTWDEATEQFVSTGVPATGNGIASAVLNQDYTLTLTWTNGQSYTTPSIRGAQGETGATGATPDFSIGTVTTLPAGSSASASITGTAEEPVLNLSIPQGQDGAITNLDTTLTVAGKAADAKATGDRIGQIEDEQDVIIRAEYDEADVVEYTSVDEATNNSQRSVVIAPNESAPYFVKSASILTRNSGTEIMFSVFDIEPFSEPDPLNRKKFIRAYDIGMVISDTDGVAKIEFDVPLYLVPNKQVLVALSNSNLMKYGTYKDALYTIYNYDHDWWSLRIGEYYTRTDFFGYQYISSGNCPYYEIDYVLASNATISRYTNQQILQINKNYSQYDTEINKDSNNAVKNSTLYNELNIVKTETIVPTETVFKNGESPASYSFGACSLEVPFEDVVLLKSVDVRAQSGDVKLGIWTLRRYSEDPTNPSYNRGYFTLKTLLGTVVPTDTHAVFDLNDVEFNPKSEILMATSGTSKLSFQRGFTNSLMPLMDNNTTLDGTAVGEECPTLYWYHLPTGSYGNQCVYTVTYQLKESKTVTTVTNVKAAVDNLIADVDEMKNNKGGAVASDILRKPINKYFCVIVDDLSREALTIADRLLAKGIRPTYGLKMESMGSDITWDEVKKLQDMGFEICFHGMNHNRYPAGSAPANDAVMIADIAEFKSMCAEHGIVLYGYVGPNHYPLPVGAFKEFEWARTPYGMQGYGSASNLATTFASVVVWSCDPNGGAIPKADMIAAADAVGDNQYLTPMCHTQNLYAYIDDYMEVFEAWIAKGLTPLRPMDAVKQSLFNVGGIGYNSTFEIQAGTAPNPYNVTAGNGIQHMDDAHGYYTKAEVDDMVGDVETLLASI